MDANGWSKSLGGGYGFDNGHMLLWTRALNPEVRPVYATANGCRRNLANAVPTRWSTKPATCACTPMST
ncbi:3-phenylpropionate dioxygenase subunit alpha [Klebsiella pneumoniae]|uniref:3-phenylpropionate dioxygenase subunit alpha n=1 Tax=Klebsiella pneumoniae TaxID=573 RepID=A0A378F378_KLEPN|nr:3-phenylpropionate dioxygenase subunit alpha [Klebsiella pneumoniae]